MTLTNKSQMKVGFKDVFTLLELGHGTNHEINFMTLV